MSRWMPVSDNLFDHTVDLLAYGTAALRMENKRMSTTPRALKPYTSALPIETGKVTLIDAGNDTFACTLPEKIALLRKSSDGDVYAVWVGQNEHHAFAVDADKALADVIERAQSRVSFSFGR